MPVMKINRRQDPCSCSCFIAPARCDRVERAFTLVEILIVVVILGILAAIVIPQFSDATQASQESTLRMDLHRIRIQLEIYKEHHGGYPGLNDFEAVMTRPTNAQGVVAPEGTSKGTAAYPFGPYLNSVPRNPRMLTSQPLIGNGNPGTSHWHYDPATGIFRANDSAESLLF